MTAVVERVLETAEAALEAKNYEEAQDALNTLTGLVSGHPQLEARREMIKADLARLLRKDYAAAFKGYMWIKDNPEAIRKALMCVLGIPPDQTILAALRPDFLADQNLPELLLQFLRLLSRGCPHYIRLTEENCRKLSEITEISPDTIRKTVTDMNILAVARTRTLSIKFETLGDMSGSNSDEVFSRLLEGIKDGRFRDIQFDNLGRVIKWGDAALLTDSTPTSLKSIISLS